MPINFNPEQVADAYRAALTYELVMNGAESGEEFVCTEVNSLCLKRMLTESVYRQMAMELWAELFVSQNAELQAQLEAIDVGPSPNDLTPFGETIACKPLLLDDASHTEDTQPPSKS